MTKITRADYGCGDNSCVFGSPGGMATNGGCICFELMPRNAEGREAARRIKRGIYALTNEVSDWRESMRKAVQEECGPSDEHHCTCVGLLRNQLMRQAQQIIEDDEEIAELYAEKRKLEHAAVRAQAERAHALSERFDRFLSAHGGGGKR